MALTHASVDLPFTFDTSAWMLPAAAIAARTTIDTAGSAMTEADIGLGDVAEFGIATLVEVPSGEAPYAFATYRIGVGESRVFHGQPALALAFRKSFAHEHDGVTARLAQLSLAASKWVTGRVAVHASGAMWDASILRPRRGRAASSTSDAYDEERVTQLAASAGVQVAVQQRVGVMLDAGVAHDSAHDDATVVPTVSLSGRYRAARNVALDAAYVTNGPETRLVAGVTVEMHALRRALKRLEP